MAWSGLFLFVWSGWGVCILDLVSFLWGLGYILPHGGRLLLLLLLLWRSFWGVTSSHLVFVLCLLYFSVSLSLTLSFSGGKAWGLGSTLYDELHWAEGKYQAFWRDGKLGDSTDQGGGAFCLGLNSFFCFTLYFVFSS